MSGGARAAPRTLRIFSQERLMKRRWGQVEPIPKWRIVRGDEVVIIRGKDRGKTGKVLSVLRSKNRLVVEGLNMGLRVFKEGGERQAGKYRVERPVHYSAVQLMDPVSKKPTRIGMRVNEDGTKVRIAKRSGAVVPRPPESRMRAVPRRSEPGPFDTAPDDATSETWGGLEQEIQRTIARRQARREQNEAALVPPAWPASRPIPRETKQRLRRAPREKVEQVYGPERTEEIFERS